MPFSPCHTDFDSNFKATLTTLTGVNWEMAERKQLHKASKRLWAITAAVALAFGLATWLLLRPKAKVVAVGTLSLLKTLLGERWWDSKMRYGVA